jgi:hypothetical protein
LTLLLLVLLAFATGLFHATGLTDRLGPLTVMQVHIGAAVGAFALIIVHYRAHPVRLRATDLDRRNLIRSASMTVAAVATVALWERSLDVAGAPGAVRRFTGSHERSSFDPGGMPSTVWVDDVAPDTPANEWVVDVDGSELSTADLAMLPHDEVTAILDCTSGWFSNQIWTGVRLDRIVDVGTAASIEVRSATGYARRFPSSDATRLWVVTEVGGSALSRGHGFPVRLVAPDRRGFWWVKWVDRITTSDTPWWVQSPFPVT